MRDSTLGIPVRIPEFVRSEFVANRAYSAANAPPPPPPPQERRRSRYRPEPDTNILMHKVCAELVLALK